jgi:hypothetical protein
MEKVLGLILLLISFIAIGYCLAIFVNGLRSKKTAGPLRTGSVGPNPWRRETNPEVSKDEDPAVSEISPGPDRQIDREAEKLIERIIKGEVIAPGTMIDGGLDLDGIVLQNDIVLDGLIISGDLSFEDSKVRGLISLNGARIEGDTNLDVSAEGISMKNAIFEGDVYLDCPAPKGIDLSDATIEGSLLIKESCFSGAFSCEGLAIDGGFEADGATFQSHLCLTKAKIKGSVDLDNSKLNALSAKEMFVEGSLYLRNAKCGDDITLQGSSIEDDMLASESEFKLIDLSQSVIGSKLDLNNSIVDALNLTSARMDDCELNNATINTFIYNGARIEDSLNLEGSNINPFPGLTVNGQINL